MYNIDRETQELYEDLETSLRLYIVDYDTKLLEKAFTYALRKHTKQKTLSGKPYISHLLKTSINLAGLYADFPSIIAGLLHDIPSMTDTSLKSIEKKFGKEICKLIQGVDEITKIKYEQGMTTLDLSFLKRVFKIGGKDIRVLLIKICDRIDFIKSLHLVDDVDKKLRAQETLDVYVPLIKIFGIGKYIGDIEDLCYSYLEPEESKRLSTIIGKKKKDLEEKIVEYTNVISETLFQKDISVEIEGRIKTIYSIAKKIKRKHIPFSGIYDLIALRVIVENKKDAYTALGLIHSIYKSKEHRIKDYISAPKPNGYQSIHTTLSDSDGRHFEVQIQTRQMYTFNMFGLASHHCYKGFSSDHKSFPKWMKKLLKQQKESLFTTNFIDSINPYTLKENIICITPSGEEIELPKKATILDFAFRLHSKIGKRVVGAWVNDEYIENLVYPLNDGDHIKLSLGVEESNYPVKYLSYLQTSAALKNLKKSFKTKSKHKRYLLGQHLLDERMELLGYKPFKNMPQVIRKSVEESIGVDSPQELYLEVGSGNVDPDKITNIIYQLKHDSYKYKSIVSLKISFKKKDTKNIHALFDVLHNLDINIINIHYKGLSIYADINVKDLTILYELLAEIGRIPNVLDVKRKFTKRVWIFIGVLSFVSLFILLSPAILLLLNSYLGLGQWVYELLFYAGIVFFIFLLYFFKHMAQVTLPGLIKQNTFWFGMVMLNTFILGTVIWQAIYIFDNNNALFFFSLSLLLYGLTLFEYLDWKDQKTT